MKTLYLIDRPIKDKSFNLNDGVTTLGRSSDNDIRISDRAVSRHHAKFLKKNGRVFIVDLNSLRGVFIDGEKMEPGLEVEIEKDSNVIMGKTVLSFKKEASEKTGAQPCPGTKHKTPSATSKSSLALDSSRNYTRSLELLLKVSNLFARSLDIDKLLGEVIDQIFDLLKRIDRGAILLLNKETGALEEAVSKTRMDDTEGLFSEINYSRSIVKRTMEGGQPVMMSDTSRVNRTDLSDSMERMNVRSVMCIPLNYKGDIRGVIYVDSIGLPEGFRKDDLQVLTGLSNTAAIAIENARLYEEVKQELAERKRAEEALQKARDQLEERVEERTAELSKTIELLRQEIAERKQAEEALRESENKYRTLLENLPQRIFFQDKNSVYISCNENYARDRNIKPDEITGKTLYDFFPKELAEKYRADDKRIMESGNTEDLEEEYIQDGQKLFVHTVKTPVKDENGNVVGILGILWDITERKRTEEALRESEEKYRTILESIEDGYFEVDIAGNLTFFNDSLCRILGYPEDELMGMNNRQYMEQQSAKRVYQIFNKVYNTGKPSKGFDWEFIRKDGTSGHAETSVSLMKDSEGHPIGFRGIARDVTKRKQIETELTQTKNFLQNILDSSIDGITTTDLSGNIVYTTPKVKDMLGYEQGDTIGKKISTFYANGVEDAKAIMRELTAKGELRNHEMKLINKHGQLVDISLSASLLENERKEVIGTLGIYRDITEKKRLEAQLAQAQRMESIGTLAGGMAHNFNNLLMAIQGNASTMLLDVDSTHPHYERLKSIEKGVQRGSRLTRQLLGYARGGKYEPRAISLNQLVKETSNTFSESRKEVVLHRELAQDLYGIKADQSQIEQSLLNLYVNAAEAMPDGGDLFLKTMNVTHKDMKGKPYEPKPGNYVLLTVRDTGTGMDKKTIDRIFDPFFTTKGLARSTGLGLASVYGIVKAHGGYIDVKSKRGQGTTFEIYLPATQKEVKEEKKSPGKLVKGKGTILLVDDEETVIDVGEQMLKKLGYEVYLAKGGQEAIDVYRENQDRIDMVLLDIVMPGMGGGRTYDSLREIDSDIKVLLSSGYDIEGKAKEILERGCDAFIQKPFNMRELSQELRKILDS